MSEPPGQIHLHPDPLIDYLAIELWMTFGTEGRKPMRHEQDLPSYSPADYVREAVDIAQALREEFDVTDRRT